MRYSVVLMVSLVVACGSNDETSNNSASNNASNNSASSNNSNNSASNNSSNNSASNNGSNGTNNGGSNNGTNGANGTNGGPDFIEAEIDGGLVRADAAEGGVEPMEGTIQLRKTTGEGGAPTKIYRIMLPNTEVASYNCASDAVTVLYSELNGQLINNWTSTDQCSIEITAGGSNAGDVVVGTFTATVSDGLTTLELTNGALKLTRQ